MVALYDNAPVTGDPVTYSALERRFTAFSNDQNLITAGEGEMRLVATLSEYPVGPQNPDVTKKEAFGKLLFNNPCDTPTLTATAQTATTPDDYSGNPIVT